ncbi:MAG: glycosyltransferase family 2 protein [Reichenbachiella sp.]|uniref:glycosyltransferase family 2 protein n=1 Tax=Reichenbachiella sp. TaxID=2184521 RepID=UPI00296637A4|nr:glycosyltransferase family 2 protein [Reichenbachiella sp.]MDW3209181.1 glycosyltransferase family 2 protein [Reichenbachiella sp.]
MNKVSVIIPTHNRSTQLIAAVESVLKQGVDGLEIIVIDDHSGEKHYASIEQLAQANDQITVIQNDQNLGVSASRNKGLDMATGEFVLFLDDDDVLLPDMLSRSLETIQEGNMDLVSSRSKVEGSGIARDKLERYNRQQAEKLNVYAMNSHPSEHIFLYAPQIHTFLVRRSTIGGTRFSTDLNYGEDIMFWLALVDKNICCEKLDFAGSSYKIQEDGLSQMADYHSKMLFYKFLLAKTKGNKIIRNLCFLKMAYVSLSEMKLNFFIWIFKAMANPLLFFRHVRVYL